MKRPNRAVLPCEPLIGWLILEALDEKLSVAQWNFERTERERTIINISSQQTDVLRCAVQFFRDHYVLDHAAEITAAATAEREVEA